MISENVSLLPYNTFGIPALARYFGRFSSTEECAKILKEVEKRNMPMMVLGGGSNVLFCSDFAGLVLHNQIRGISFTDLGNGEAMVTCGAGEVWHEFVLKTLSEGWQGLENLSLIPGSVGASPMQNIGAYGVEIKDVFEELEALNINTLETQKFDKAACQFGYRESIFKRSLKGQYIITSVTFRLRRNGALNTRYGAIEEELTKMKVTAPTAKDISEAVMRIRRSKLPDPRILGNAGSFFKNPVIPIEKARELSKTFAEIPLYPVPDDSSKVKTAAGWLIEHCGWKGYRKGAVGVHEKQALVLVNHGGATGQEVYELSAAIIASVSNRFGIELEREVNMVG